LGRNSVLIDQLLQGYMYIKYIIFTLSSLIGYRCTQSLEIIVHDYIDAVGATFEYRSINAVTLALHFKLVPVIRRNTDHYRASLLSDVAYEGNIIDSKIAFLSTKDSI
jgi:hypothetical protein